MEWQWRQLEHMQIICTSLQTDNHGSTSSLNFLHARSYSWRSTNSVKVLKVQILKINISAYGVIICKTCFQQSRTDSTGGANSWETIYMKPSDRYREKFVYLLFICLLNHCFNWTLSTFSWNKNLVEFSIQIIVRAVIIINEGHSLQW